MLIQLAVWEGILQLAAAMACGRYYALYASRTPHPMVFGLGSAFADLTPLLCPSALEATSSIP